MNLRKVESAKDELASEQHLANGALVTEDQIMPFIEGGPGTLKCAQHGKYLFNPIGIQPRCTVHGSTGEMEAEWKRRTGAQERSSGAK
jgi:hypothetical protein